MALLKSYFIQEPETVKFVLLHYQILHVSAIWRLISRVFFHPTFMEATGFVLT